MASLDVINYTLFAVCQKRNKETAVCKCLRYSMTTKCAFIHGKLGFGYSTVVAKFRVMNSTLLSVLSVESSEV